MPLTNDFKRIRSKRYTFSIVISISYFFHCIFLFDSFCYFSIILVVIILAKYNKTYDFLESHSVQILNLRIKYYVEKMISNGLGNKAISPLKRALISLNLNFSLLCRSDSCNTRQIHSSCSTAPCYVCWIIQAHHCCMGWLSHIFTTILLLGAYLQSICSGWKHFGFYRLHGFTSNTYLSVSGWSPWSNSPRLSHWSQKPREFISFL